MLAHQGGTDESLSVVIAVAALWVGWIGWSRVKDKGFLRMPRGGGWAMLGLAGGLVIAAVFVPRAILGPKAPTGPRPASTATLAFLSPANGAQVTGDELEVSMSLTGGRVVDASSTTVSPDTGHIHLSLDGRLVSMTYGTTQTIDVSGLTAGPHTLEAEFVAVDHAPFDPRVRVTETFTKVGG